MENVPTGQKIIFNISSYVEYARKAVRIQDVSLFDYLGSYIVIYLLILMTNTRFNPMYFTAMLPLAVLAHIIFKQKTPLTLEATNDELNVTKVYLGIMVLVTIYYYKYY